MPTKEELFSELLSKSANSKVSASLVRDAGLALRNLPKGLDSDLLERTLCWFASSQSAHYLWQSVRTFPECHSGPLQNMFRRCAADPSPRGMQARFLLAAQQDGCLHEPALQLVHQAHKYQSDGTLGMCPTRAQDLSKLRPFEGDPRILDAGRSALTAATAAYPQEQHLFDSTSHGLFWQLVALLALRADTDDVLVLNAALDSYAMRVDGLNSFRRVLRLSDRMRQTPSFSVLTHRLRSEVQQSAAWSWVSKLKLQVPHPLDNYWSIGFELQTGRRWQYRHRPQITFHVETIMLMRHWKIVVATDDGASDFGYGASRNDLGLTVINSPLDLPLVLTEAAETLGVEWSPRAVDFSIYELQKEAPSIRRAIMTWLATVIGQR